MKIFSFLTLSFFQSSHNNFSRQPNIPRASAHKNVKLPTRHNPPPAIPNTQISPPQLERRHPTSSGLQLDLVEPAELLRRCRRCRRWVRNVKLWDFGASHAAAVGYLCGYGRDGFKEIGRPARGFGTGCRAWGGGASYGEIGIGEICVGCGV